MSATNSNAPVRICVFGPKADPLWIAELARGVTAGATIMSFNEVLTDSLVAGGDLNPRHDATAAEALRAAATRFPGDDLILVRSGIVLPPLWCERLLHALAGADALVVSPLDNADPFAVPLPAGRTSSVAVSTIDALCYRYSRHKTIEWTRFSPLLSAWRGARLRERDLEGLASNELPAQWPEARAVLLDHLYVADPSADLRGPPAWRPGTDRQPPSALGELRESLAAALAAGESRAPDEVAAAYPGLDGKPVVLHVLHGWGGGAERFVRDLAAADHQYHHLVLIARGNFPRRSYGEILELRDGPLADPPLRRFVLPDPIRSTVLQHDGYAAFFADILNEFGVSAVIVSSLIGHSLDALRSGLPTLIVGHDFYPLWPVLHRDFGDPRLLFDDAQLTRDLSAAGSGFEFTQRDPGFWRTLRDAYVSAVRAAQAQLVAPSRSMLANLLTIEPRFTKLPHHVIAHGLAPWPANAPAISPRALPGSRLRLVMLGRVRAGKGANLLRDALPGLREHAEVFLLGAGAEGEQFFGERDVHVVLDYRRDELPALLAQVAPDAALLLPTVAETFSYTLSELSSLGVPAIATRVGALAERIDDGVDGWLVAPNAEDIVATVARLRMQPDSVAAARAMLQRHPPRETAQMAADYRAALPLGTQPLARYRIARMSNDLLVASARAGELGEAARALNELRARSAEQYVELERRAQWAMGIERDLVQARKLIVQRDATIQERTEWAQSALAESVELRAQLARAQERHAHLQREFDERTHWAKALDAELLAMRTSTSWRLTRPLRYLMRKYRALRVRVGLLRRRLGSITQRTRGSLASRGAAGTLRRIRDEFQRGAPLQPIASVAEPLPDAEPFSIPCADAPRVSIVVPVYNKLDYTIACLRSLGEHAGSIAFEVIVIDDASADTTPERLAQIAGVRYLRNAQNLGFIGSCNAGAAAARGEFVLFLNNDTVVTAGWLEALLRCFDEEPDAGLVGSKLVYPDGRLQEAGGIVFNDGSGWNYGRFDDPADPKYNFRRECDYCSGAAVMLRRALFERLGGFDTRYAPAYYEDTDLAFAVRAQGLKVFYEPRSTVVHFEGVTAGTDVGAGMKRFQGLNQSTFVEKWKDQLRDQPARIHEARLAPAAANHRARGRLLIVDAYTPTPDQDSGSLRMVNLMRLLRARGDAIAFLPDNRSHDGAYTEALQALGVEALYHPYVQDPVAWIRERGPTLTAIVLSRHYIAVNYIGAARLYAPQARLVFDTVDLHYLREERAAALEGKPDLLRHAARTKAQELKLMRECDVTLVVSSVEQELLRKELPQARIEVLSNVHEIHGCRVPYERRRDLVFVGGFQHPPNIDAVNWFVSEVMPLLRAQGESLRLHVIGSKVPSAVLQLACDDVSVHGFVPDISPYMDSCRLSVAPLRYGAGVKGKVNMAMSYGLPVVATGVAIEGMHVRPGTDIMVADTAGEFASAIRNAYEDATLWKSLSDNGLANVRQHFSFDAAREALARILP